MAAANGNDDDGNIWAGYVDALTTMTMVMTLIMMLLGIVVFGLSQEISRRFLVKIAQAADVDASPTRPTALIADEIVERLARRPVPPDAVAAAHGAAAREGLAGRSREQDAEGAALQPLADAGAAVSGRDRAVASAASAGSGRPAQTTAEGVAAGAAFDAPPVPGKAPVGDSPSARAGNGPTDAESADLTATILAPALPRPGSTPAPAIKDSPPVPATPPTVIESTRDADLVRLHDGATVASGLETITIRFKDRAMLLDDESTGKLRTALGGTSAFRSAKSIEISASADSTGSTVTDARRFAYYRVLSLRKEFVASGFESSRFVLKITDDSTGSNANTVRLTARP